MDFFYFSCCSKSGEIHFTLELVLFTKQKDCEISVRLSLTNNFHY